MAMRVRQALWVTLTAGAMILSSVGLAAAGGRGDARAKADGHIFTDLKATPWAQSAILEMAFQGIVNGEGQQQFAPNGLVTMRQLAAIMARFAAREGDQQDSAPSPQTPSWAAGGLGAALRSGLLPDGSDLKPNAPASRADVVAAILSSLHVGGKVKVDAKAELKHFKDAQKMPEKLRKELALAVQLGLIQGVGGSLQASGPVTRAELATILARVEAMFGQSSTLSAQAGIVQGTVAGVDSQSVSSSYSNIGAITLKLQSGVSQVYDVAPNAQIYAGPRVATLAQVQVGEQATIGLNQQGLAALIMVASAQQAPQPKEGQVTAISSTSLSLAVGRQSKDQGDQNSQGTAPAPQVVAYPLASSLLVTFDGASETLAQVSVGSRVRVSLNSQGQVDWIEIRSMQESVTGTVESGQDGGFLLSTANNQQVRVHLDHQTTVTYNGQQEPMQALAVGDQVIVNGTMDQGGLRASSITVTGITATPVPITSND